jgi:hypothetical protein
MTIKAKVLATLRGTARLCDDCLSEATGVTPRQSINIACRAMNLKKVLGRATDTCERCRRTKIVNYLSTGTTPRQETVAVIKPVDHAPGDRPWYWEGSVQRKIVEFLIANRFTVQSAADTASRQQGKDIVARSPDGQNLWVTVKGFPEKSKNVQARHWFAGALHDLARYRDESPDAVLAIGLPRGFTTYERLISRSQAVRRFLGYRVYWVGADGKVSVDNPT